MVSTKIRNYEEMFVEPPIYIRYVVLTIVIFTSMLAIDFFIVQKFVHFMDIYLSILYLSIYWFVAYPWQGLRSSGNFGHVHLLICWYRVPINSEKSVGWLTGLTIHAGKLLQGKKKTQMSQWVQCDSVPPLKESYCTTPIFLGIRIYWGRRWIMWRDLGWGQCYN